MHNQSANRSALTRAINSGDNVRIIRTATAILESFETYGYPDDWSRYARAADDARFAIARETR